MTLLTQAGQQQVADLIERIERDTDAELVTVLAARADDYRYIALLWAGLLAMLLPGGLLFFSGLQAWELLLVQWSSFVVLAFVLRIPALTSRLIPRAVRHWRAGNLARRQFFELELHHTHAGTGVLIFVSEAERYVEILVDQGISSRIEDAAWASIIEAFTAEVKAGRTLAGFLGCIESCGELLQRHVPLTEPRDELPNRLVVIE
ncbi:TPM domain-containing protein [Stutzerimonas kirkiae]|uniref:TPM domain-containing protein n=1 Tax=Stutzerimonas kirkiae TaxID=2211392 RepID=A0A4Q9R227_9GAMM|nr:TPM domain-containing protein [Stutzerimonas kirkiae]TBU93323.1 hypothetical protein DNJ96_14390 [Stutzerimonas kirkiae]TBV01457.1 hypothetical protein DNJ95_12335 [Stutzerimonas kirkiae]TBV06846.1 hypothetical protein DNK08_13825 [Stutzerimonas kirkiae]TBV09597.1 hypothetical protein DNK01_18650 [Stutzerimonas kirkiae]